MVSLKILEPGSKEIIGGIIVNETTSTYSESNPPTLEIHGAIKILFSRSALHTAEVVVPANALTTAHASLPAEVVQSYWRSITP
jgi:hypothetical protein